MARNPLFRRADLTRPPTPASQAPPPPTVPDWGVVALGQVPSALIQGRAGNALEAGIPALFEGLCIDLRTWGVWSTHEVITHLLGLTGPAEVWVSTWAISEDAVRALVAMLESGYITSLNCLFDFRVKGFKAAALQLARFNATRLALGQVHAKVTVILNDEYAVRIISSANLTENPRIEVSNLCVHRANALEHRLWMNQIIQDYLIKNPSPIHN